jgi:hypothetical protein
MHQRIRGIALPITAAVASLALSAADASAQACIGVPAAEGQNVIAGSLGFPTGLTIFGAEFHHNLEGNPFTLSGRFEHWNLDGQDGSINFIGAGGTYDLTGAVAGFPDELSFCVTGGLRFGREGGINMWEFPIGVGFGAVFPLGEPGEEGITLIPFGVPAIYHARESGEFFGESFSTSSTDLDVILGATGLFGRFHATMDLQNVFRPGSAFVSVRFGTTF